MYSEIHKKGSWPVLLARKSFTHCYSSNSVISSLVDSITISEMSKLPPVEKLPLALRKNCESVKPSSLHPEAHCIMKCKMSGTVRRPISRRKYRIS